MENTTTRVGGPVHAEDVLPVRSRVSWGAIVAGAVVTLALLFLFTMLGLAVGLTAFDQSSDRNAISVGAAVWATIATLIALFVGGYVTSQLAVGENKMEAGIYGVILWGVVFSALLWLAGTGVTLGNTTMIAVANGRTFVRTPSGEPLTVRAPDRVNPNEQRIEDLLPT